MLEPARRGRHPARSQRSPESWIDEAITERSHIGRVSWALSYVGLLGYTFAIVTYALPIGEASMVLALIGLFFLRGGIRFPAFLLLFGGLILWSAAGLTSTQYPTAVYDAMDRAVRIWLVAFLAVNAIRTPAQLRFYLLFFLACFALYPARGAIFNYLAGYTVWGRTLWNHIFANPNDLAALTFLPMGVAAALFATERYRLFKWGALASLVVLPVLILMTQSRGALMALVLTGLLALVWSRNRGKGLAAVAGLALVAALVVPDSAWERFSGMVNLTSTETIAEADVEGSAGDRFNIWKVGRLIALDHPGTGVGLGAYHLAHEQYAPLVPGAPTGRKDAHSTYLWVLATTGFPGLLLFIGIIVTSFRRAERARARLKRAAPKYAALILYMELGLVAYLIAGVFGSFVLLSFLYLHLSLIWVAGEIGDRERRRFLRSLRHQPLKGEQLGVAPAGPKAAWPARGLG